MKIDDLAKKVCSQWYGYQNLLEIEFALRIIADFRPRVILEIGTAFNASLAAWAEVVKPELAIGIDPLTLPKTEAQQTSFDYLVEQYNLKIIGKRSDDPEAHTQLEQILGDKKVDFLFIDAEHIYEDVVRDFEGYKKYMSDRSIIGFHDIYYSKVLDKAGTGVWRLWNELKNKYNYDEIHYHSSMGIGIIYYPNPREDMKI